MEKKLLDTNIFIDFLKGKEEARIFFETSKYLSTSVIVVMELIAGFSNQNEVKLFEQFLHKSRIKIYPLTTGVSEKAYLLFRQYYKSHGISIPDTLIAATALLQRRKLVTRNMKHFQMIKDIKVFNPYS